MRTPIWFRILLVVILLGQFAGTHFPVYELNRGSTWGDKVLHFLAFLILMISFRMNWPQRRLTIAMLVAGVYGGFDELTQKLAIGRQTEFLDWIADLLGALTGYYMFNRLKLQDWVIRYSK